MVGGGGTFLAMHLVTACTWREVCELRTQPSSRDLWMDLRYNPLNTQTPIVHTQQPQSTNRRTPKTYSPIPTWSAKNAKETLSTPHSAFQRPFTKEGIFTPPEHEISVQNESWRDDEAKVSGWEGGNICLILTTHAVVTSYLQTLRRKRERKKKHKRLSSVSLGFTMPTVRYLDESPRAQASTNQCSTSAAQRSLHAHVDKTEPLRKTPVRFARLPVK